MNKLVISSIVQFSDIAKKNPGILNINSFSLIKDAIAKATSKPGCKCNVKKDLTAYRPQFETAMMVLSPAEQTRMKTLLNVDEICYYQKESDGRLKQLCF